MAAGGSLHANNTSDQETSARQRRDRANLVGLLLCFLSILSICLTAFNLYLFAWIWSNLSSSPPTSAGKPGASLSLMDQLELFRESDRVSLGAKLALRRPFEVAQIRGAQAATGQDDDEAPLLRLSSASEIVFGEWDPTAGRGPNLIVSAKRNSLQFAAGLIVHKQGSGDDVRPAEPSIECEGQEGSRAPMRPGRNSSGSHELAQESSTDGPFCRLKGKHFKLNHANPVDFSSIKSIQTKRVRAQRIHSALQKLQLMSGRSIRLESLDEQVQLFGLDSVGLGRNSPNSSVIIRAKTIDLSGLVELAAERRDEQLKQDRKGRNGATGMSNDAHRYKVCICLRARPGASAAPDTAAPAPRASGAPEGQQGAPRGAANNGRVFAVPVDSRCSKFTGTFCNLRPIERVVAGDEN